MAKNGSSRGKVQGRDYISLGIIQEDENLAASIKRKIENVPLSHCISKVPEKFQDENDESYSPKVVSLGPLHSDKSALKVMEDHKWRYVNEMLNRRPNIDATIESCVTALKELERRARNSYGEEIDHMGTKEFVTMLLIDGCFTIELFLKIAIKSSKLRDDPLLNTLQKLNLLRRDMILLENQIPFFVLQRLFYIVPIPKECDQTLVEMALRFFRILIPGNVQDLQDKFSREGHHLLDLVRSCHMPRYSKPPEINSTKQHNLQCATMLVKSGVRIKRADGADSAFDMTFAHGILWLPPLQILSHTGTLMRNMIALEQCTCECTKFVSSYAIFMKSLVRSKDDVKLLHKKGVLVNTRGREEEICAFFEGLCKGVSPEGFYYEGLFLQLGGHRRTNWWYKWCEKLILG